MHKSQTYVAQYFTCKRSSTSTMKQIRFAGKVNLTIHHHKITLRKCRIRRFLKNEQYR